MAQPVSAEHVGTAQYKSVPYERHIHNAQQTISSKIEKKSLLNLLTLKRSRLLMSRLSRLRALLSPFAGQSSGGSKASNELIEIIDPSLG